MIERVAQIKRIGNGDHVDFVVIGRRVVRNIVVIEHDQSTHQVTALSSPVFGQRARGDTSARARFTDDHHAPRVTRRQLHGSAVVGEDRERTLAMNASGESFHHATSARSRRHHEATEHVPSVEQRLEPAVDVDHAESSRAPIANDQRSSRLARASGDQHVQPSRRQTFLHATPGQTARRFPQAVRHDVVHTVEHHGVRLSGLQRQRGSVNGLRVTVGGTQHEGVHVRGDRLQRSGPGVRLTDHQPPTIDGPHARLIASLDVVQHRHRVRVLDLIQPRRQRRPPQRWRLATRRVRLRVDGSRDSSVHHDGLGPRTRHRGATRRVTGERRRHR